MLRIIPTIAVLGTKDSGKTTLIRRLIKEFCSKGERVMSAKHVHCDDFTMDREGTDTWYHSEEGADPVLCISNDETTILHKQDIPDPAPKTLLGLTRAPADVLVMEGFSKWTLGNQDVAKIILVKDHDEMKRYCAKAKGPYICFLRAYGVEKEVEWPSVLKGGLATDIDSAIKGALDFLELEKEVAGICAQFKDLDCGKCGHGTCMSLARAIRDKEARAEDCPPFVLHRSMGTKMTVGGEELGLQRFTSEFVRRTILGMASALKNVEIRGDEVVEVAIRRSSDHEEDV